MDVNPLWWTKVQKFMVGPNDRGQTCMKDFRPKYVVERMNHRNIYRFPCILPVTFTSGYPKEKVRVSDVKSSVKVVVPSYTDEEQLFFILTW